MSVGFQITEALTEALRMPYSKGDTSASVMYLLEGIAMGEVRVMVKKNFDTACWVPPVGKRAAHSIYYGDRMLERVFKFWASKEGLALPTSLPKEETEEGKEDFLAILFGAGKGPNPAKLFDYQVKWLKANCTSAQWSGFMTLLVKAVAAYGRHEREHALKTPQDLKQVNKDLAAIKVPFQVFNLFEDSRIEHWSRHELNSDFDWVEFEALSSTDSAFGLYLRCIQLEGLSDDEALNSEAPYKARPTETLGAVAKKVQAFYARACECQTADALYPVMQDFLKEFADEAPPPDEGGGSEKGKGKGTGGESSDAGTEGSEKGEGSGKGEAGEGSDADADLRAGDLTTAAEAQDKGDEFFTEFEADAEVVGGSDAEGKAAEAKARAKLKAGDKVKTVAPPSDKNKGQGIPESVEPQASSGRGLERHFLAPSPGAISDYFQKRVDNLTQMLMRMFKTHSLPQALERPGRRMSSKHLARGELKFIHPLTYGGKGKRKYSIVYDCSGSMNGKPDREGKIFLLALNNLAKRGLVEGSLILSGYVSGASWLQYKLPVKDELILRISTSHGSEGLQDSLKDNLKHIKGMDDVFVYTDACICDAPINRGFFAKHKIWPVGLYVGDTDNTSEMEKHFPQNITKDTIEQVVETMLIRNRRTVG